MTAAQLQVATEATKDDKPRRPAQQPGKGEKPATSASQQLLRKQPRLPKSVLLELDRKVTDL